MKVITPHFVLFGALFQVFLQASIEDNQNKTNSKKKTSRYGLTWFDGDLWAPDTVGSFPVIAPHQSQQQQQQQQQLSLPTGSLSVQQQQQFSLPSGSLSIPQQQQQQQVSLPSGSLSIPQQQQQQLSLPSGSLSIPQQPNHQLTISQAPASLQIPQQQLSQTVQEFKKQNHQQVNQDISQLARGFGGGVHAENIHCIRSEGITLLSAIVIPPPEYISMPVFEDAVSTGQTSADCIMRPHRDQRLQSGASKPASTFAMHVNHFAKCGVRIQQGSDGKEWISVTLRFPFMAGLRMAEDEYVMIMCKPQEKTATSSHVFDLRGTATEGRSVQKKKIFRSGPKDVACRMTLMTKTPGTNLFTTEMKSGALLRLGQELQIRGRIREGDGWKFAVLKDVVISRANKKSVAANPRGILNDVINSQFLQEFQRDHLTLLENFNNVDNFEENNVYNDQRSARNNRDEAYLVLSDGCRNPSFRAIAPQHPRREPTNPLEVIFGFRAFMFQDMLDGESLRLSAQVVACAELEDCQHVLCLDEAQRDFGKRRRRSFGSNNSSHYSRTENFTENFELTVEMEGFSKTAIMGSSDQDTEEVGRTPAEFSSCRNIILAISVASCIFCLATTIAAAIAIATKKKKMTSPFPSKRKRKYVAAFHKQQQLE